MWGKYSGGARLLALGIAACLMLIAARLRTNTDDKELSRRRRGVMYVQGSILQFAFGLQVPTSIPNKTVNINVGLQANYMLPSNASQFHRARRCDRGANLRDTYTQLEELLHHHGFTPARQCLLRSICEAAAAPFVGDLFEEIVHIVLTPSEDPSVPVQSEMEDSFLRAEMLGREGGSCQTEFATCSTSPLQLVSEFVL